MKRKLKQGAAAVLALILTAALAAGQLAFASPALGTELTDRITPLSSDVTLVEGSLWSATYSDLRTEHYLTYTPGGTVRPMLYSGKYVATTTTVAGAASVMEGEGYRVVAGVNGGFFNTDGTIVGMLITEGVVRALDPSNYTLVGIRADGSFFVEESAVTKTVTWPDGTAAWLDGFNAYRTTNGLYLYNQDFSSKVNAGGTCVYAVLQPVGSGEMKMNGTLELEVVSVADTSQEGVTFNGVLPQGGYMLYASTTAEQSLVDALRALAPGQRVRVSVGGVSQAWQDAVYGLSALETLVRDGQVVSGLPAGTHPRTAIGIRSDGSVIFYTIDGRQSGYSVGATYTQVAQRLVELGCVTAVALDGGGSTTLGATLPGQDGFEVLNQPSGGDRRVNNSILLLAPAGSSLLSPGYGVQPEQSVILSGASMGVSAAAYDAAGRPVSGQAPVWGAAGGTITGTTGGQAVYTAGANPGVYQITASGGGAQGSSPVRVVQELSALRVYRQGGSQVSQLVLKPGEQVELSVSGSWYNLPVALDGTVQWQVQGNVGTVDAHGRFTAGQDNAVGSILVSAGGRTVNITVKVDRGDPFTDMAGHWASDYVTALYQMGITTGFGEADGTYTFRPTAQLSRGELLVFLARMLKVDVDAYDWVELPFQDAGSIPGWVLPSVKALYALQVFEGSGEGSALMANVSQPVSREAAMTMMGRVLATIQRCDLSAFGDGNQVSGWAAPYVETLVSLGVVEGSGGLLTPQANIDRGAAAKLLVLLADLDKAQLSLRPGLTPPAE